jgi:predicted amidohydrolase
LRAALAVNYVTSDFKANLASIGALAAQAASQGAELVLFPETAVTGLINNDDPGHDLPLGRPIPGALTGDLGKLARELSIYLGIGLFEREGRKLFDSAILISPSGRILLKHRRLHPGWTGPGADRGVYALGDDVPVASTEFGRFAFLICGDLWDAAILSLCASHQPDYLLYPFARCFANGKWDQERWDREEREEYIRRAGSTGATVLMVNYLAPANLEGGAFGGAMIVSSSGVVSAELPLGQSGILVADI